jgi:serine/threonine protein kinase/tetratricopeptide (TPR) repeat protein
VLVEHLAQEMARRWHAGECPLTEEYLDLYPALWSKPEAALELIYEEIDLRQKYDKEVAVAEILDRFPAWRPQLEILLACHHLLETGPAAPGFPIVGETLEDFHLLAELGRGAQGRVFLATQPLLADRPVVLKLTPRVGQEHLSLARLQHTHIVPLYSSQDYPARNLRGLCMPYFGGATLAQLLEALRGRPPGQRTGQHLLQALQRAQSAVPVSFPTTRPAGQFLAQASYVQAICWIGACLADALQYAHERDLLHLDLKPSNVLLAADGQPMLLDFHLARAPLPEGAPAPEWLGGTLAYMAPEQQAALIAVQKAWPIQLAVDGRADIYSLGVVLYEALGGTLPLPEQAPARRLERHNPRVPVGLADLLEKCLAQDPRNRYVDAAALAADLRRHLTDLPLRGVPNRSLSERWRKWRRRRPLALPVFSLVLAVLAAGAFTLAHVRQQLHKAERALHEGHDLLQKHQYGEAVGALRGGLALAEDLPFHRDLTRTIRDELRLAEGGQAAQELHLFVERIRVLYGADCVASHVAGAVEARCRTFWEQRELIVRLLKPQADADLNQQIQSDLLDLAILWTNVRVCLAGGREAVEAAHREALEVLAQAEALFGPSRVLALERQDHAAALGLTGAAHAAAQQGSTLTPRTAWEHYAVGRTLLRAGKLSQASVHLKSALDLQPQGLWLNFYWGKCAYQLAQYEDAVLAFTACTVLAPESAWCYYNRGLAYTALRHADRALADYDRALQLDPKLAAAALNRGMLRYEEKRYPDALADLQRALDNGADRAMVSYDRALVYLAQGNRHDALASVRQALRHNPEHKEARMLLDRLLPEP